MRRTAIAETRSWSSGSSVMCSPIASRRSGSRSAKRISLSYFAPSWACRSLVSAAPMRQTIVVLDGDETGQELLEEALRVLAPEVTGLALDFPRFDLSLQHRRATTNAVVHEAAAAIREAGLGLKA